MKHSDVRLSNYVNSTMDEIYDIHKELLTPIEGLTDLYTNLYEELMEADNEESITTCCNKIKYRLRDIRNKLIKESCIGFEKKLDDVIYSHKKQ